MTHRALVLPSLSEPFQLLTQSIPEAIPGTAIIRVLATTISPNSRHVFSGKFPIPLATPVTPCSACIGRIHSTGPDSTSLNPGDLVFCDLWVRARDDPDTSILQGYMTGHTLEQAWTNGSYAEYACIPLERVFKLDESAIQTLGYSVADLCYLGNVCIPMAGLLDVNTRAGDTVVVAPATGTFGGSTIPAALSLGAKVVACGRNAETLAKIAETFGVETVVLEGGVEKDAARIREKCPRKGADVFVDFSPPKAVGATHTAACTNALRPGGIAVLMGAVFGEVGVPYWTVMRNNIRVQGRYMFERWHAEKVIALLEMGRLKLGKSAGIAVKIFKMEQSEEMLETAEKDGGWGKMVVLEPCSLNVSD